MRIKKAVAYDTRQSRFTAIDSATLDPGMEQRNGKEVKREAELSGKKRILDWLGARTGDRSRKNASTYKAGWTSPPQTVDKKLFSPEGGRIALSANERIDEFLDFAI